LPGHLSPRSTDRLATPLVVSEETTRHASVSDYKAVMSAFPTGVAVITSTALDGRPHGITCSSLVSVTLTPPTLLVCIRSNSPTLAALRDRQEFAVNLLHVRGQFAATLFATPVGDRFSRVRWSPSHACGLPWLHHDAFAVAECRLSATIPVKDHVMVLGEVVNTSRSADLPLLYGMRQFSAWPGGSDLSST